MSGKRVLDRWKSRNETGERPGGINHPFSLFGLLITTTPPTGHAIGINTRAGFASCNVLIRRRSPARRRFWTENQNKNHFIRVVETGRDGSGWIRGHRSFPPHVFVKRSRVYGKSEANPSGSVDHAIRRLLKIYFSHVKFRFCPIFYGRFSILWLNRHPPRRSVETIQ